MAKVKIKIKKKGSLGGRGFFGKSDAVRHKREIALAKRIGERKVQGKLQAISTFNKNTNPTVSMIAKRDRKFIAESFIGKKKVRRGAGLSKKKK